MQMRTLLPPAPALAAPGAGAPTAPARPTLTLDKTAIFVKEGSGGAGGTAMVAMTSHRDLGDVSNLAYSIATSPGTATVDEDYRDLRADFASLPGLACADVA